MYSAFWKSPEPEALTVLSIEGTIGLNHPVYRQTLLIIVPTFVEAEKTSFISS